MSKILKSLNFVLIGLLAAGSATVIGVEAYRMINKKEIPDQEFQYTDTFRNLRAELNEEVEAYKQGAIDHSLTDAQKQELRKKIESDGNALGFYDNCTSAVAIKQEIDAPKEDKNKFTLGTIWSYPTPKDGDSNRYYFATNIHVILKSLIVNAGQISINPKFKFYVNRNAKNEQYADNFSWLWDGMGNYKDSNAGLDNLKLESIGFRNDDTKFSEGLLNESKLDDYSDFAILSTTQNPFGQNVRERTSKLNLAFATPEDMDLLFNPKKDVDDTIKDYIYICGFPGAGKGNYYSYKTIKIYIDKLQRPTIPYEGNKFQENEDGGFVARSTARAVFNNQSQYKTSGLKLQNEPYVSYANQMIIPGLNIGGGSSGSVFTAYIHGQLKILGIWWGAYSSVGRNSKDWDGAGDLFISNKYISHCDIGCHQLPAYDNTKIRKESLNTGTSGTFNNI